MSETKNHPLSGWKKGLKKGVTPNKIGGSSSHQKTRSDIRGYKFSTHEVDEEAML
jgi:hypothetical protein